MQSHNLWFTRFFFIFFVHVGFPRQIGQLLHLPSTNSQTEIDIESYILHAIEFYCCLYYFWVIKHITHVYTYNYCTHKLYKSLQTWAWGSNFITQQHFFPRTSNMLLIYPTCNMLTNKSYQTWISKSLNSSPILILLAIMDHVLYVVNKGSSYIVLCNTNPCFPHLHIDRCKHICVS